MADLQLGLASLANQLDLLLRIGDNIGGDRLEPPPARPPAQTAAAARAAPTTEVSSSEAPSAEDRPVLDDAPVETPRQTAAGTLMGLRPPAESRGGMRLQDPLRAAVPQRPQTSATPHGATAGRTVAPEAPDALAPSAATDASQEQAFRRLAAGLMTGRAVPPTAVPPAAETETGSGARPPTAAPASTPQDSVRTSVAGGHEASDTAQRPGDARIGVDTAPLAAAGDPAPAAPGDAASTGDGTPSTSDLAEASLEPSGPVSGDGIEAGSATADANGVPSDLVARQGTASPEGREPSSDLRGAPPPDEGRETSALSPPADGSQGGPAGTRRMNAMPDRPGAENAMAGEAQTNATGECRALARGRRGPADGRAGGDGPRRGRGALPSAPRRAEAGSAPLDSSVDRRMERDMADGPVTMLFDRPLDLPDGASSRFGFPADGSAPILPERGTADRLLSELGLGGMEPLAPAQPERAGVIASFVLNAAMIPGWPPPRPIEGVAVKEFAAQWPQAAKLSKSDLELLLYLANLGLGRKQILKIVKAFDERRRRSKLMRAVAVFLTNVTAMLTTVKEEVERTAAEEEDEQRLRQSGHRSRIGLR